MGKIKGLQCLLLAEWVGLTDLPSRAGKRSSQRDACDSQLSLCSLQKGFAQRRHHSKPVLEDQGKMQKGKTHIWRLW